MAVEEGCLEDNNPDYGGGKVRGRAAFKVGESKTMKARNITGVIVLGLCLISFLILTNDDVRPFLPLAWQVLRANCGDSTAQVGVGIMFERGIAVSKNYAKAVEWYRRAADQGDSMGQVCLGLSYQRGLGVSQDYSKAVELYGMAAEKGDSIGLVLLGRMYENGFGVPEDYSKAVEWYRRAVDQGYSTGQVALGIMYEKGRGVPQDNSKAAELYQKALEQGDESAREPLARTQGRQSPPMFLKPYACNLNSTNLLA